MRESDCWRPLVLAAVTLLACAGARADGAVPVAPVPAHRPGPPAAPVPATNPSGPTTRPIAPIQITLHESHASAADILGALSHQCGDRIVLPSPLPVGKDFSIDIDHQPFWPAVCQIGQLLDLNYDIRPDGAVELLDLKDGFTHCCARDNVLFKAEQAQLNKVVGYVNVENSVSTINVAIGLSSAPDQFICPSEGMATVSKVVDDKGRDLTEGSQLSLQQTYYSPFSSISADSQFQVCLTTRCTDPGKAIAEVSGIVKVMVGTNLQRIDIPLDGPQPIKVSLKQFQIIVDQVTNNVNGLMGHIVVTAEKGGPRMDLLLPAWQRMIALGDGQPMIAFQPPQGTSDAKHLDLRFFYRLNLGGGPVPGHVTLSVIVPQSLTERNIPFTLKDVPLP